VDYVLDPAGLRCPQYIWEAEPDGYKITFFFIDSIVIKELMHPEVKWTMKDFTPLGGVRQAYRVIAVSNSSSFNDINDLKSADRVIFGTLLGTAPHLSLQMFAEEFGVEASYVGYEGMNDALIGLIRGDVDAANLEMANIRPYVDSGDVRVLAYLTTDSDPAHADLDIPTADEVGLTFLSPLSSEPCAYFGPPGMDQELAKLFTKALRESLEDEYLRMWSDKTGYSLKWMEPELITEHIEKVYDLYRQNVDYLK
jgi:tripartite-type tricarboxylate transporter receptor subunit TctC